MENEEVREPSGEAEELLYIFLRDIAKHHGLIDIRKHRFRNTTDPLFERNLECIKDRIANNWTPQQIAKRILDAKDLRIRAAFISEILPPSPPVLDREDQNLLIGINEVQHPELKEYRPPIYDLETGKEITPGEVSVKVEYTLGDLIDYCITKLDLNETRIRIAQVLRYLLNSGAYTLDDVLEGIDIASSEETNQSGLLNTLERAARIARDSRSERAFSQLVQEEEGE